MKVTIIVDDADVFCEQFQEFRIMQEAFDLAVHDKRYQEGNALEVMAENLDIAGLRLAQSITAIES